MIARYEPASLVRFLPEDNYDYEFERRPINLALSRGRGSQGDFQGQCRAACAGQSQGERWRSWGTRRQRRRRWQRESGERRRPLRRERGSALSLSLFGTRSKTRDTTVARYISKVKDLLFSLLSLSRSTFAIIPLSIDLSLPRSAALSPALAWVRKCACTHLHVRTYVLAW